MYGWNIVRACSSHCPSAELAGEEQLNSLVKVLSLQAKCRPVSLHTAKTRPVWSETWTMREAQFLNITLRDHQKWGEEKPQRHCRNEERRQDIQPVHPHERPRVSVSSGLWLKEVMMVMKSKKGPQRQFHCLRTHANVEHEWNSIWLSKNQTCMMISQTMLFT